MPGPLELVGERVIDTDAGGGAVAEFEFVESASMRSVGDLAMDLDPLGGEPALPATDLPRHEVADASSVDESGDKVVWAQRPVETHGSVSKSTPNDSHRPTVPTERAGTTTPASTTSTDKGGMVVDVEVVAAICLTASRWRR